MTEQECRLVIECRRFAEHLRKEFYDTELVGEEYEDGTDMSNFLHITHEELENELLCWIPKLAEALKDHPASQSSDRLRLRLVP